MPDRLWSKGPGPIGTQRKSVDLCHYDWRSNRNASRTSAGKPTFGCAHASRRLVAKGQHANVVTVALARELAGFMWAMAKAVPGTA